MQQSLRLLKKIDADIVCLQEVHTNTERSQADEIAYSLGLSGVFESVASESHINVDYRLANAILAKRQFQTVYSFILPRPHFLVDLPLPPSGEPATIHDKLVQVVQLDGLTVANTHLLPLPVLGASWSSSQGRELAEAIANLLIDKLQLPLVLCGDFNYPDVTVLTPNLVNTFGLVDVLFNKSSPPPATPRVDHILVSDDLTNGSGSEVIPAFADHLPCVAVLNV